MADQTLLPDPTNLHLLQIEAEVVIWAKSDQVSARSMINRHEG
ncbi:hypothetical protein KSC_104780 [Ktedonobacter sp. SOSP1-52]|nr:hypothetical protein [Ktedonobacter sp. SOSP1-52]GHO71586.1 hypothetical protein KSC_104780 [Ktedonobacter sp. SOSP1-52]